MRFVVDFIGALREAGLPVSPAESLDALNAIKLIGLDCRDTAKAVLGLTLVKRQSDQITFDNLFDLYFASIKRSQEDKAAIKENKSYIAPVNPSQASENSALGQSLENGEDLSLAIAQAAVAEKLSSIVLFTQKNHFTYKIMQRLGDEALTAQIRAETDSPIQRLKQDELIKARQRLLDQVKEYVEQQYVVFAKQKSQKYRELYLHKAKLSQLEHSDFKLMQTLVHKAARKLASQHSRRRLTRKRGMLDVRKTLAANAAFDGALFHTRWKATRIERPKIVAICDVSGSVSRVARFLLLFLYSLQDVMPKVRSFVFASQMVEVTQLFEQQGIELALKEIMQIGRGHV